MNEKWTTKLFGIFCALGFGTISILPAEEPVDPVYRVAIERDWELQENERHRSINDIESLNDAILRGRKLYNDLSRNEPNNITILNLGKRLELLAGELELSQKNESFSIVDSYRKVRWINRTMALENPLVRGKPIIFLKRNRFACQMMHEYLGYYYEQMNLGNGDLCLLENPGITPEFRSLIGDQLPPGVFQTLSLSYDGKTAYFAYVKSDVDTEKSKIGWLQLGEHDFQRDTLEKLQSEDGKFQIYTIGIDGTDLKKLTDGSCDNFDPAQLPDGGIVFLSTNRGGFVRCNNPWEPLPVYTLHRMNPDGSDPKILSFHETNEWHPSILNDGRIAYCRWDYMDRSAAHYHGIWTSHPDGTHPAILFGNYTQQISAFYQPRAIPGSKKIMFVAGAHHADTGGSLAIIDPTKIRLDPQTALDDFQAIERVTPEVPFPETPDQNIQTYYHSPWPLSENYYLTAYSHEPLGCFLAGSNDVGRTGLYYLDRFGNLELLYEDEKIACQYPIPLEARVVPPAIPSQLEEPLAEQGAGELLLTDVNRSLVPLANDREIRELRIFQILPKWPYWTANQPKLGYANAESARTLLGTVPVESDGSAFFQVPAGKMVYFQAVDAQGRAVQTMRSVMYLQPGERRSCVGCHEPIGETASEKMSQTIASQREASIIEEGPSGSSPWSFTRLVQPILDKKCVHCHGNTPNAAETAVATPDLTGTPTEDGFCESYRNLRPFVRWYEWGGSSIQQTATLPNHCGAEESPLPQILRDENHATDVELTDSQWPRLYLWLDGNAAFYGVQDDEGRRIQREGGVAEIPTIQ